MPGTQVYTRRNSRCRGTATAPRTCRWHHGGCTRCAAGRRPAGSGRSSAAASLPSSGAGQTAAGTCTQAHVTGAAAQQSEAATLSRNIRPAKCLAWFLGCVAPARQAANTEACQTFGVSTRRFYCACLVPVHLYCAVLHCKSRPALTQGSSTACCLAARCCVHHTAAGTAAPFQPPPGHCPRLLLPLLPPD